MPGGQASETPARASNVGRLARMEELEVVARQLRRHAVRRKEGVPTVSLLVGEPAALAITLERSLAPAAVVHSAARQASPVALARLWLSAVLARHDLISKALSAIEPASRPEQVLAAWRARSAHERAR